MIGHQWVMTENSQFAQDTYSQSWRCMKCGKRSLTSRLLGSPKPNRYDVVEYLDGSKSLTCEEQIMKEVIHG